MNEYFWYYAGDFTFSREKHFCLVKSSAVVLSMVVIHGSSRNQAIRQEYEILKLQNISVPFWRMSSDIISDAQTFDKIRKHLEPHATHGSKQEMKVYQRTPNCTANHHRENRNQFSLNYPWTNPHPKGKLTKAWVPILHGFKSERFFLANKQAFVCVSCRAVFVRT